MDDKIIEAIKSDNLDLFKLLFDYKRILLDILDRDDANDLYQLIGETMKIRLCMFFIKDEEEYNYSLDFLKLIKNNIKNKFINRKFSIKSNEFQRSETFKFLYDPKEFFILCKNYNSAKIFSDYLFEIDLYHKIYARDRSEFGRSILIDDACDDSHTIEYLHSDNPILLELLEFYKKVNNNIPKDSIFYPFIWKDIFN